MQCHPIRLTGSTIDIQEQHRIASLAAMLPVDLWERRLPIAIRIAWDTMLSPIDERTLPLSGWRATLEGEQIVGQGHDGAGEDRRPVHHAVRPATAQVVQAYIDWPRNQGVRLDLDKCLLRAPTASPI